MKEEINQKERIFLKPGKNNKEDRLNFVKFWADYVRTHTDKEWSKQQNILIDGQIAHARMMPMSTEHFFKIKSVSKSKL